MTMTVEAAPGQKLYRAVVDALRDEIETGRFAETQLLPAERVLWRAARQFATRLIDARRRHDEKGAAPCGKQHPFRRQVGDRLATSCATRRASSHNTRSAAAIASPQKRPVSISSRSASTTAR